MPALPAQIFFRPPAATGGTTRNGGVQRIARDSIERMARGSIQRIARGSKCGAVNLDASWASPQKWSWPRRKNDLASRRFSREWRARVLRPNIFERSATQCVYLRAISSHARIIFCLNGHGDIV